MRIKHLIFPIFLLSACTIQQQNGNEMHFQGAPLFAGNHWQTTQQFVSDKGDRICTVSAGEMNVGQRAHGKSITYEISTSTPINPGDHYRVIYRGDVHETPSGGNIFDAAESKAIIADLMKGGTVYTEIQQREIELWGGREFERIGNKIDLGDFGKKFKECEQFVSHR